MKIIVTVIALLLTISSVSAEMLVLDRNGNFLARTGVRNADGSISGVNGQRTIERGNKAYSYDSAGRFIRYGILRGNIMRHYSSDGRYLGHTVSHGSTTAHYDARGRFLGTALHR